MTIFETSAKSLLRKAKRVDSWFLSRYGMNLYRGCAHDCAYCDGRAEGYHVGGEFGVDVEVKTNALDLLSRELDPRRRRKPLKRAFVCLGGGVGDAYQPAEARYGLARGALELIGRFGFPVHVLTKSALVERDLDVIARIDRASRAVVSMSFSTVEDRVARVFEPGCAPPSRRLEVLRRFKDAGVPTGAFLMPVIPFVTDHPEAVDEAMGRFKEAGVDFVLASGMTLKAGRQRDHFTRVLEEHRPGLEAEYEILYGRSDRFGGAHPDYYRSLDLILRKTAGCHGLPLRMPPRLYADLLDDNDRVAVMLSHLDYFARADGSRSPFGVAASAVANLESPMGDMFFDLGSIRGVGPATRKIISEILRTGTCARLEACFRSS